MTNQWVASIDLTLNIGVKAALDSSAEGPLALMLRRTLFELTRKDTDLWLFD
jgi:hypothetical protein